MVQSDFFARVRHMKIRHMNTKLQKAKIRGILAADDIDMEMFDIDAHFDSSLNLTENIRNIKRISGVSSSRKSVQRHTKPLTKRQKKSYQRGLFGQTGKSNTEIDKHRKAKPPGERRSKSGRKYTERRKNRSDRPGTRV